MVVLVAISKMSSVLIRISDTFSAGFMFLYILRMLLGHIRDNSVGDTYKYNKLLKPKWNLS